MNNYLSLLNGIIARDDPIKVMPVDKDQILATMIQKRGLQIVVAEDAPFSDPVEKESPPTSGESVAVDQWYADSIRYLVNSFLQTGKDARWVANAGAVWGGDAEGAARIGRFHVIGRKGEYFLYFVKYQNPENYGFRAYQHALKAGDEELDGGSMTMLAMVSTIVDMKQMKSWPRFGFGDLVFAPSPDNTFKQKIRNEIVRGEAIERRFDQVLGIDGRAPWVSVLGWRYELHPIMRKYSIGDAEFYFAKMADWPVFVLVAFSTAWKVDKLGEADLQDSETDRSAFQLSDSDVVDVSVKDGVYSLGVIRGDGFENVRMPLSEFRRLAGIPALEKDGKTNDDSQDDSSGEESDTEEDPRLEKSEIPPGISNGFVFAQGSLFSWPVGEATTWSQYYVNRVSKVIKYRHDSRVFVLYDTEMLGLSKTVYDPLCMFIQREGKKWVYLVKKLTGVFEIQIIDIEPNNNNKRIPPPTPGSQLAKEIQEWIQDAHDKFWVAAVIEY